jgi:hypothetical protein
MGGTSMPTAPRAQHLDHVLTGLAMYEAWERRDRESISAMVASTSPEEAVDSLLASMEVMSNIFAAQLGTDTDTVISAVRRRIILELGSPGSAARRKFGDA